MSGRRIVPLDEALDRIGTGETVHTFANPGGMLIGADHDREDIIKLITEHGVEEAGGMAASLGHTLVCVKGINGRALFIEAKAADVNDPPRPTDQGDGSGAANEQ